MGFNLFKKKSKDIVKDVISTSFGFGTKKERIDESLRRYKKSEIDVLNRAIANRNILLSELKIKIANYENLLKPIEEYLDIYKKIEELSEIEVTKPDSQVTFSLNDLNGNVIVTNNYSTLRDVIRLKKFIDLIVYLIGQLEEKKECYIKILIDGIIKGKGKTIINKNLIENMDLYYNYLNLIQIVNVNSLTINQGNIINNFEDATKLKEFLQKEKYSIGSILISLRAQLNKLTVAANNDENSLKIIEQTKEIIRTSEEYVAARTSHEYLEEIKKLK